MATNLFKFFSMGSDGLDFLVGALGIGCAAGRGNMYAGSGLFWSWAVALGSKFMGFR